MGEDDEYSNNYSTILYEKNLNTDCKVYDERNDENRTSRRGRGDFRYTIQGGTFRL